MPGPQERAKQVRELFAERGDIVTVGFEQLEQGSQVRSGQRQIAAVVRRYAVHELVYPASEVSLIQWSLMGMGMQALTSRRLHEVRRGRAPRVQTDAVGRDPGWAVLDF
jgi:hypothetical protein